MQLKPFCYFTSTILACVFSLSTPAVADELTGRWTGAVELRGNYYYENSTRVVAPEIEISLESPKGVRMHTGYLVDSITSASIAAGALEDVRFREIRHDVRVGAGYEFDLGESQFDIDASFRVSKEPDYLSTSGGLSASLSLDEKNTILRASIAVLHDEVRQNFRGGAGIKPTNDGGTSADAFNENFNALSIGVGWEQLLGKTWTLQTNYGFGLQRGFLANAYRSVLSGQRPETHPDKRQRHSIAGRLSWHIPKTRTSLHAMYRAYFDSWDIGALNPEVRVYQELSRFTQVRVRYRYYKQTSSFFYESDQTQYTDEDLYVTADPKMSPFRNHEIGGQLILFGKMFETTRLKFLQDATFDLNFDYIFSTSTFGNGVVAIVGLRVPF